MIKLDEDLPRAEPAEQDAPVPKLPRGSGFKLSTPQLMRIGMTVVTLIAIVALQKPCSNAVGRFVTTFGGSDEAAPPSAPAPTPASPGASASVPPAPPAAPTVTGPDRSAPAGAPPIQYERLSPSMTDAELRAAIERAKRRAAAAEAAKGATPGAAAPVPSAAPSTVPSAAPSSPPVPSSAGSGGQ